MKSIPCFRLEVVEGLEVGKKIFDTSLIDDDGGVLINGTE
jgi:hypothetical protein